MDGPVDELRVVRAGSGLLVVLVGEVDLHTREALAPALWAALADPDVTSVRIDAGAVDFLDSSGLSVLVRLAGDATQSGRSVAVTAWSPVVRDLLESTGVDVWMTSLGCALPER